MVVLFYAFSVKHSYNVIKSTNLDPFGCIIPNFDKLCGFLVM